MVEISLTEAAIRVLRARYLLKDEEGNPIETPEMMFRRVARTIALADAFYFEEVKGKPYRHVDRSMRHIPPEISEKLSPYMLRQLHKAYVRKVRRREVKVSFREFLAILAERWEDVFRTEEGFFELMTSRRFIPNSPTLMNAGAPLGQLSACFVIPVEDSIEGIMDALTLAAKVQKSGGGTGYSFSRLRPEGDIVHSTGGTASGPVSFMKLFDTLTEVIKQGGKRRGANMGVLDVHHPDIEKFITCKADGKSFQNFNISVAVSDEFMEAVIHGRKYPLINPRTGEVVKMEDARYIWNLIVQNAWRTGDPGLIFIDRINRLHPARHLGKIEATNPCVSGDTKVLTPEGWKTAREIWEEAKRKRGLVKAVAVDGGVLGVGGETLAYETVISVPDLAMGNVRPGEAWVWHVGKKPGLTVEVEGGYSVTVTSEHKFLTAEGWKEASRLKRGDLIAVVGAAEDDDLRVHWARIENVVDAGIVDFYDFTVPGTHTYIANGILHHNCGEQPLLPYESCNLGSINLSKFVRNGEFDEEAFREVVRKSIHFLDNVIDMNMMPDERLENAMLRTRKVGLGVMGFADALVMMGIQYDSNESLEAIDLIGGVLKDEAHRASVDLASTRGVFPAYKGSLWDELGVPRRNAAVTTIAPTGSISIIAGCSSSIEPYFALVYYRKHAEDVGEWMDAVPLFIEYLHRYGIYSEELLREVAKTGSVQHVEGVPGEIKRLFRTAHDIHYEWHVKIQARWQKYIEASISKTINLPHDARPEDISRAMMLAYELGAKGVTVYRDRSKDTQVLMKPIDLSKLKVIMTEDKFVVDEQFGGYCRTEGECD